MKIVGIIAEYDPFHNGHRLQIAQLRALGAQAVVVCMSCDLVQRGGFALLPPKVRAKAALACGADLVLALPNPWACASAEAFGAAGVALLSAFGCDTLAFGAETPDAQGLLAAARALDSPAFAPLLHAELAGGQGYALARARALAKLDPALGALVQHPNDLLGVEYCKAILRQGCALQPLPLLRRGAGHHASRPQPGGPLGPATASGSTLRGLWAAQGAEGLAPWVPEPALACYRQAQQQGLALEPTRAEVALLARLRGRSRAELAHIRGVGEGLENRLAGAVARATSLEELYGLLKTKRYAHARLRRLVMDGAMGWQAGALPEQPPFLWVLGARRAALPLCKAAKLPCGVSLAALAKAGPQAGAAAQAHADAADLAALCRRAPQPMGLAYTQKPVLL